MLSQVFLILFLSYCVCGDEINNIVFKYKTRVVRHCKKSKSFSDDELQPFYRNNILENPVYLIFLIFLGILFILLLLGLLKAFIGLCCSRRIGEFGLGVLVDLPKPLDKYQEKDLKDQKVIYDVGGWPVHPETKERTVRVLPRRTEFCLNVTFFMAYPLALILQLCALCCCIKNYNDNDEAGCFKRVNIIKCNPGSHKKGGEADKYGDNDAKERADTKYVINQMKLSQISLQKG